MKKFAPERISPIYCMTVKKTDRGIYGMYVSSRDSQCILVITLYEQLHIEHTLSLLLVYDNAYNGLKLILKKTYNY